MEIKIILAIGIFFALLTVVTLYANTSIHLFNFKQKERDSRRSWIPFLSTIWWLLSLFFLQIKLPWWIALLLGPALVELVLPLCFALLLNGLIQKRN